MKLRSSRTLLVAAAALVFGSAAYGQGIKVRARVPFDFVVNNKVYPAGEYAFQTAQAGSFYLSIMNEDRTTQVLTRSYPCVSSTAVDPVNQTKLVFHRVGNTYFLFRLWVGGDTVGRQFAVTHRETQMAINRPEAETTIVAANIAH